ncbi:MAG: M43 family zinc metalloprotease [Saprospiraceae bacterium]
MLLIIFYSIQINSSFAQNPHCGFNEILYKKSEHSDYFINNVDSISHLFLSQLNIRSVISIPVVVHIVWRTNEENINDEKVISQINVLNRDFNSENGDLSTIPDEFKPFISNGGIHFCLASKNPQGLSVSGIVRSHTNIEHIGITNELYHTELGGSDAWDTKRYYNIWVANLSDGLTGFGAFPGMVSDEKDGAVINYKYFGETTQSIKYNLGRVTVHETGHYLGLKHIWGDDEDCNSDDDIGDTPPQLHEYTGCPAYPQYSCDFSNMFMNFMDYVNDGCMVFFTEGQMKKMISTLINLRPGLVLNEIPCVQINGDKLNPKFKIFPNPASRELSIYFEDILPQSGEVNIYNEIGQSVFKQQFVFIKNFKLGLPDLIPGFYCVKIENSFAKLIISN